MRSLKLIVMFIGLFFLASLSNVLACHRGFGSVISMQNHAGFERYEKPRTRSKRGSGFGLTTEPTTESTGVTSDTAIGTTDQSIGLSATSTNCDSRTANINKFFQK